MEWSCGSFLPDQNDVGRRSYSWTRTAAAARAASLPRVSISHRIMTAERASERRSAMANVQWAGRPILDSIRPFCLSLASISPIKHSLFACLTNYGPAARGRERERERERERNVPRFPMTGGASWRPTITFGRAMFSSYRNQPNGD